jgi:GT2 family glycosyltransferase
MLAYNHGKYIEEAVNSVINQSIFRSITLIISNDASTDDTKKVISQFDRFENVITYNHSKNLGITDNAKFIYSKALELNPKYIATLEGDDYWIDNDKLKKQYEFLEDELHSDVVLVCGNFNEFDQDLCRINESDIFFNEIKSNWIQLEPGSILTNWKTKYLTYLIRAQSFKELDFIKYKYLVDYILIYELNNKGKIYFLNETLGIYRRHKTGNFGKVDELERNQLEMKIYRSLLKHNLTDSFLWSKYRKTVRNLNNLFLKLRFKIEYKLNTIF